MVSWRNTLNKLWQLPSEGLSTLQSMFKHVRLESYHVAAKEDHLAKSPKIIHQASSGMMMNDKFYIVNPRDWDYQRQYASEIEEMDEFKVSDIHNEPHPVRNQRSVRITKPAKNVSNKGRRQTTMDWEMDFNTSQPDNQHVAGWLTASGDALANTKLHFPTQESAIRFCENHGWDWGMQDYLQTNKRRATPYDAENHWPRPSRRSVAMQ